MDQFAKAISEEQTLSALYIKIMVELHNADHLVMNTKHEDSEYHIALRSAVTNIGQRTEISNNSARDRKFLMTNTLYFLLGELERGCEMKRFRNARYSEECLARVRSLMKPGSLYFPIQRDGRDSTASVNVGEVQGPSGACCRAQSPIKK